MQKSEAATYDRIDSSNGVRRNACTGEGSANEALEAQWQRLQAHLDSAMYLRHAVTKYIESMEKLTN